jgi:hypothetical protein
MDDAVMDSMPCSCGERIYRHDEEPFTARIVFQHGENPEHVRFITMSDIMTLPTPPDGRYILNRIIDEWVESIHEYETQP